MQGLSLLRAELARGYRDFAVNAVRSGFISGLFIY